MNELIQKLAEQARQIGEYGNYGQIQLSPAQFEQKFAELLVKECAGICYNSGLDDSDAHAQNLLYEFNIDNCRNDK